RLPAHARRFAQWWALREHELAERKREAANRPSQPLPSRKERARSRKDLASSPPPPKPTRRRRLHARRIGPPPGCCLKRFDPDALRSLAGGNAGGDCSPASTRIGLC